MNIANDEKIHPLTPHVFHILLALAYRPLTGYNVHRRMCLDSGGGLTPSMGSVYKALHRLKAWGFITQDDSRRYSLQSSGRVVLEVELDAQEQVVQLARHRLGRLKPNSPPSTHQPPEIDLDSFIA